MSSKDEYVYELKYLKINSFNNTDLLDQKDIEDFMNILDKAIYNYRLSCGRSTDNKELNHQGELAISGEVKSENTLKYTAEEMKQIQATTSEPDEEVQEFLDQI